MTDFWMNRRVLITGHTGFKGSWLALWLHARGATVAGLALEPDTVPSLFRQLEIEWDIDHCIGDIREVETLRQRITDFSPEIIFHLAAQPLVRRSYEFPRETWATNVMGTVHLLDVLRNFSAACAVVVVTTDKVYHNREWLHAYREEDRLGGHDPYSASKAACELVVESYRQSFFAENAVRLASARAGNVIGGGDWAEDRVVPDLVRAFSAGVALGVRNAAAIRPWQHVLDPLAGYMRLAEQLWLNAPGVDSAFNFGPDQTGQRTVRDLTEAALQYWPGEWNDCSDSTAPHEAGRLSLTTDKARALLGWSPRWDFEETVRRTMDWYRAVEGGASARDISLRQIRDFEGKN